MKIQGVRGARLPASDAHVYVIIGVGEGGEGATAFPLGSYLGRSGSYPGKFENIRANLKRKTFFL